MAWGTDTKREKKFLPRIFLATIEDYRQEKIEQESSQAQTRERCYT
jgi:hypothetical protein